MSQIESVLVPYQGALEELKSYVPQEAAANAESYLALVSEKVMGRDKAGRSRPLGDFLLFMSQAKRTGLDPLARQVYAVYRYDSSLGRDKMSIQTSIDGFRLIAHRTGQYGGQDDAVFDTEDAEHPNKASVTVYQLNAVTGERMPVTASARWSEYSQAASPMWKKMPYTMLAKCAEGLALRKAFPQELSGLITSEEVTVEVIPNVEQPKAPTEPAEEAADPKAEKIRKAREKLSAAAAEKETDGN